jgi:heme A synthase
MLRDLRKYAAQTHTRLIVGGVALLLVVGLGLVALLYGVPAALMGLLCILGMLIPIALVGLVMLLLDVIVKKSRGE